MELFEDFHASWGADVYRPLLAYIQAKHAGRNVPPHIPKWDLMPLYKLCKLASLFQAAKLFEEASHLAAWLLNVEAFPTLWCNEKEFDEKKFQYAFSKLRELVPVPGPDPEYNLVLIETPKIRAALTLDGKNTSLGAIQSGVDIRAFGPQSDHLHFGIHGKGMDGWTRSAAYAEVWLEMSHKIGEDGGLGLNFRFIGIKPETPLSLAFYIKAQSCQIGSEELKPKSLRRFLGEAKKVSFDNQCFIESSAPQRVEIIPLAGQGCFWDTQFLLSYPINAFAPQISLYIY